MALGFDFSWFRGRLRGYEHPELIELVFRKTVALDPDGEWPAMAGARSVLDFGGACGAHYKLARRQVPVVRWAVVETPAMVAKAAQLSTDSLKFFTSIPAAAEWLGSIDIMHSSGALQYVPEPEQTLAALCRLECPTMVWARMNFSKGDRATEIQTSRLIDNGPGAAPADIKDRAVKYSVTKIREADFIAAHAGYTMAERTDDSFRFVKG